MSFPLALFRGTLPAIDSPPFRIGERLRGNTPHLADVGGIVTAIYQGGEVIRLDHGRHTILAELLERVPR